MKLQRDIIYNDYRNITNMNALTLWFVCMVICLNMAFVYGHHARNQKRILKKKITDQRFVIPSMFPKRIIHYQPFKALLVKNKSKEMEKLYNQIIFKASQRHKIDTAMVKAIIMVESGYHPYAVSKKGAQGLMQLMPSTAEYLGVEDSFNPEQNINAGVKYYKRLLKRYNGNVKLALAAYNAGIRNVLKYKGIPPFRATRYYIRKVLKYRKIYKNQKQKMIV